MRKNKKFLTFMVAASLCAVQFTCPMSMVGFAAEQTIYTGTCGAEGDNITWTYDTETKTMTFSGTGAMKQYIDIGNGSGGKYIEYPEWVLNAECWDVYKNNVEKIIFEEGITDIGILPADGFGDLRVKSLFIPESVQNISLRYVDVDSTNFYTKYGSYFYYEVANRIYAQNRKGMLFSTGIAENPIYPTEGTSETGLTWNFDYETRTLTVSGTDGYSGFYLMDELSPIFLITKTLILEKDFTVPSNIFLPPRDVDFMNLLHCENTYCYANSAFADVYESSIDYYKQCTDRYPKRYDFLLGACKYIDNSSGDVNLDGKVDLMDAIYLNKYTANILQLTDAQKVTADCNGDGDVNDVDATTLMEFLILQIPSLPYTGAEA